MHYIIAIQAWAQAHPALVVMLWPLATAIVNIFFGAAEKYAESHPRFHAVLAFLEASGLDVRGTIDAIAKLIGKDPPSGGGGDGHPYRKAAEPEKEPETKPAAKPAARAILAIVAACCVCGVIATISVEGCNPTVTQQVVNTIPPATNCVLDIIDAATAGSVDIAAIIKDCGTTAEDIIAIVSGELQHQDAGAAVGAKRHDHDKLIETYRKAQEYRQAGGVTRDTFEAVHGHMTTGGHK